MARKEILKQFHLVTAASMGADVTSNPVNIAFMDDIAVQLNFTGTPVGTFQVQVSLDHVQDTNGNVTNSGNWISVSLSPAPTAAGSATQIAINLQQLAFPWMRVVYTRTSGTGTLDAWVGAKEI